MLRKLQYYPLALLLIIFLFGLVLYYVLKTLRVSEQNRLWAAMAKETAHQIGTPLSSMLGWIALGKEGQLVSQTEPFSEMEKDVNRLQLITERFSKIGSLPTLQPLDINKLLKETVIYLENRTASQVTIKTRYKTDPVIIAGNAALLSWTLENLIKNGIDAMKGAGELQIWLEVLPKKIYLFVQDQGLGVARVHRKKIFNPGYSTKKRGWGLGLSLAKRIIENYHQGRLELHQTEVGKGTTFRITLARSK